LIRSQILYPVELRALRFMEDHISNFK